MGRYYVSDIRQSANQQYRIAPASASRNPDKTIRNPLVFFKNSSLLMLLSLDTCYYQIRKTDAQTSNVRRFAFIYNLDSQKSPLGLS